MTLIPALLLSTLLAAPFPALAQQAATTPQAAPVKAPDPDPDPAVLKAMKSKVFVLLHHEPMPLASVLYPLQSGTRGAKISWADRDGLKVLSVRDFPENIAAIEEAIKRLDVPSTTQPSSNVELHIQVLIASKQVAPNGLFPDELQEVIKSLKGALSYRSYTLAASFVQRCDPKIDRMMQGRGLIEGLDLGLGSAKESSQLGLEWEASQGLRLEQSQDQVPTIRIVKFQFQVKDKPRQGAETLAKIETSVSLKEGDRVVVGTSMINDRGLIVVLSARRVN